MVNSLFHCPALRYVRCCPLLELDLGGGANGTYKTNTCGKVGVASCSLESVDDSDTASSGLLK